MKKRPMPVAVLAVCAGEPGLNSTGSGELSPGGPELPAPGAGVRAGENSGCFYGVITSKLHLLALTAKSQIFVFADAAPLFREFVNMWTPILERSGLNPVGAAYKDTLGKLDYHAADGRVLRDFIGEHLHYTTLDPADVEKVKGELLSGLERAGLTPAASFIIDNKLFRARTFNVYYLTKPEEVPAHEVRLRQLVNGDGEAIDFDLLAGAVRIVREDAQFSLVYIGKELGRHRGWSDTEEGAKVKLEEHKQFLKENKQEFIGSRIVKLDKPYACGEITVSYLVNSYFYW